MCLPSLPLWTQSRPDATAKAPGAPGRIPKPKMDSDETQITNTCENPHESAAEILAPLASGRRIHPLNPAKMALFLARRLLNKPSSRRLMNGKKKSFAHEPLPKLKPKITNRATRP